MNEEMREELSKLLWHYTETAKEEKVEALQKFLREKKIPPITMLSTYKHHCEETHFRAVNALSYLTVKSLVA